MIKKDRGGPYREYGKKMRGFRQESGLTQSGLARRLGLTSAQFVSNIERGIALLPATFVPKVSRMYGIKKQTLIDLYTDAKNYEYTQRVKGG